MSLKGAGVHIQTAIMEWPGVTAHPHRFGGVEYRLGTRELGHIHGDHLVDIPFPTRVRDELVAAGLAEPHHNPAGHRLGQSLLACAGRCRARY